MSTGFLETQFFNNQVSDYLVALLILAAGIILTRVIQSLSLRQLKRWAQKTPSDTNSALMKLVRQGLTPLGYLGTFYIAIGSLSIHPVLRQAINVLLLIISTFISIQLIVQTCEYLLRFYWRRHDDGINVNQMTDALVPAIRSAAYILGIIFLLDNLGFNISAVLTGLGIGGVALALASQGIFEDLFSYFAILLDRPFELGDFIVMGDYMGTIQRIGIKTTRLQSLSGEEIIIGNKDLTTTRVRNYKRMEKRRIVFKFGVTYETSQAQLQKIPDIIRSIIENVDQALFDRAHFSDYGNSSLNYEVVYYVYGNDYTLYMDIQQAINLKLKTELEREGIEFAYPK